MEVVMGGGLDGHICSLTPTCVRERQREREACEWAGLIISSQPAHDDVFFFLFSFKDFSYTLKLF